MRPQRLGLMMSSVLALFTSCASPSTLPAESSSADIEESIVGYWRFCDDFDLPEGSVSDLSPEEERGLAYCLENLDCPETAADDWMFFGSHGAFRSQGVSFEHKARFPERCYWVQDKSEEGSSYILYEIPNLENDLILNGEFVKSSVAKFRVVDDQLLWSCSLSLKDGRLLPLAIEYRLERKDSRESGSLFKN